MHIFLITKTTPRANYINSISIILEDDVKEELFNTIMILYGNKTVGVWRQICRLGLSKHEVKQKRIRYLMKRKVKYHTDLIYHDSCHAK